MGIFTKIIEDSLKSHALAQNHGKLRLDPPRGSKDTYKPMKALKKAKRALKINPLKKRGDNITTYMGGVATDFTNMQPGFGAATLGYSINGNL